MCVCVCVCVHVRVCVLFTPYPCHLPLTHVCMYDTSISHIEGYVARA